MIKLDAQTIFYKPRKKSILDLRGYFLYLHRKFYKQDENNKCYFEYDEKIFQWQMMWDDLYRYFSMYETKLRYALLTIGLILFLKGTSKYPLFAGAIAFDSATGQYGNVSSLSFAHTCTGTNLVLLMAEASEDLQITVPTYNGVNATLQTSTNINTIHKVHYLANPATGSNTATFTAFTAGISGQCCSFSGADTSAPIDVSNTATGTSTAPSVTATTNYANSYIFDSLSVTNNPVLTVNGAQTQLSNFTAGGRMYGASRKASTGAGSYSMSWTLDASNTWSHHFLAVKELTSSPVKSSKNRLSLLGVGM